MNRKIAIIGLMLILGIIAISGCLQKAEQQPTQGDGAQQPPQGDGADDSESSGIPTPPSPEEGEDSDSGIPNIPI